MDHAKLVVIRMEEARDSRGISVAELGRRASIDRKRLWYILDGQRQMRADEFVRLCVVLDMGLRSFLTVELVEEIGRKKQVSSTPTRCAQPSPLPQPYQIESNLIR